MRHFKVDEFKCPCCGRNEIRPSFLAQLDEARDIAQTPFVITSGYRCKVHNRAVGGVDGSSHTTGHAADIAVTASSKRFYIVDALLQVGFSRIGISNGFIHVDTDPDKPDHVMWTY